MALYGQMVIGAPGAGKSTYCSGIVQVLTQLKRPVICVNLDPANDIPPFHVDVDIRELIKVEEVMERLHLGPNGALRYCMRTLAENIDWLKHRLSKAEGYVIIDMPGQLELYNSDDSLTKVIRQFERWGWQFCALHLSDSMYCSDPGKFISVVLSALSVMVNLEVPQINVLSKVDLLPSDTPYNMEFFEQLPDLRQICRLLDDHPFLKHYKGLSEKLCDVIEDYNLVNFTPLDVNGKSKMLNLLKLSDGANGFTLANANDIRDIVMR
jgi:GTPase SAR1 family protein